MSRTPTVDPAPFLLPGSRRAAALCLHGLTGTPYEVRSIGEAVAARGIEAMGPVLPGHNETTRALSRVGHDAWLASARAAAIELRKRHARVLVAGLSMGGLLALCLAAEGLVDAAAVVAVPLRLRSRAVRLVPVLKHLVRELPKKGGSDIRDDAARERHPGYRAMPLASVHELLRLQRVARAGLARIRVPLLVAHGVHDRTAHPDDARAILDGVSSEERQLLLLADSGHVVPVDRDSAALAAAVADFFERHA